MIVTSEVAVDQRNRVVGIVQGTFFTSIINFHYLFLHSRDRSKSRERSKAKRDRSRSKHRRSRSRSRRRKSRSTSESRHQARLEAEGFIVHPMRHYPEDLKHMAQPSTSSGPKLIRFDESKPQIDLDELRTMYEILKKEVPPDFLEVLHTADSDDDKKYDHMYNYTESDDSDEEVKKSKALGFK